MIDQVGLGQAARRKAGGYSLGMRQRLGIAAAMLGDPPILMLDEPFNGMDPEGIIWMRGFLRALAAEGRAVLVSSHLMSELQDIADHVVVVGRGRVIADTSMRDLIAAASGNQVTLRTTAREQAATALAGRGRRGRRGARRADHHRPAAEQVVVLLNESAIPFAEVSAHRASLEDAYLRLTQDAVEFRAEVPGTRAGERRDDRAMTSAAGAPAGRMAFAAAARAEWVKFRTVRGWVVAMIAAVLAIVALGLGQHDGHLRQERPGLGLHRPGRAGRRGGDGQLLLRAPAADREREHHRPGDVADRADPQPSSARQPGCGTA